MTIHFDCIVSSLWDCDNLYALRKKFIQVQNNTGVSKSGKETHSVDLRLRDPTEASVQVQVFPPRQQLIYGIKLRAVTHVLMHIQDTTENTGEKHNSCLVYTQYKGWNSLRISWDSVVYLHFMSVLYSFNTIFSKTSCFTGDNSTVVIVPDKYSFFLSFLNNMIYY